MTSGLAPSDTARRAGNTARRAKLVSPPGGVFFWKCFGEAAIRPPAERQDDKERKDMSNKKENEQQKKALVANLKETWKNGDFSKTSLRDLIWLAQIAAIRNSLGKRPMNEILNDYRKEYEDSTTPQGRASKRCGDELSILLTGLDADTAIRIAETVLALEEDMLLEKYASLNEGQRKMNAGNRIRGGLKREDITIKDVKAAMKAA